ncbi:MAG: SpoIIE family protein phosphatase [Herpetosiphon sp.]
MLELQAAVSKISKYASSESGDTVETIERPQGGVSFVVADGQGTGRGAKTLSNLVTAKAITMLKDGARDGAVARAVHDYLYGYRHGQVSCTLNIISVDLSAGCILMSRNNPCPYYVVDQNGLTAFHEPSQPIGLYPNTKPTISHHDLAGETYVVAFTDGVSHAGTYHGTPLDVEAELSALTIDTLPTAQQLAEQLLGRAIEADQGRPTDDMTVVVLAVLPAEQEGRVRRLLMSMPLVPPPRR